MNPTGCAAPGRDEEQAQRQAAKANAMADRKESIKLIIGRRSCAFSFAIAALRDVC